MALYPKECPIVLQRDRLKPPLQYKMIYRFSN